MIQLKKGILIAIEGIDGSGKSSLAQALLQQLQNELSVLITKEPGSTALGKHLRTLVQEKKVAINPKAEFLLFAADRAQHFQEIIIPALAEKKLIISDRMADSSLVYQGYGRGLDKTIISLINNWVMEGITPDLTFYIKVDVQIGKQRILQRNAALSSFEKETDAFLEKLIEGFSSLYMNRSDVIIIDGNQEQEKVTKAAYSKLKNWLKENNRLCNQ